MTDRLYTTNQLAKLFGVVPTTVIDWIEAGRLRAFKTLGGHRRITHSSVLQFLDENNLASPPAFSTNAPKILLLDDEGDVLALFEKLLGKDVPEAEVLATSHAVEALVRIGSDKPAVIVFDLYMPDMDGFEFCERLRAAQSSVKMVAISGDPTEETQERILAAGADHFLPKTEATERLAGLCRKLLQL